jgi:hypothetical protein
MDTTKVENLSPLRNRSYDCKKHLVGIYVTSVGLMIEFVSPQCKCGFCLSIVNNGIYITYPAYFAALQFAHLAREGVGSGELHGSILARRALDQVLERGSILNTGVEGLEIPKVTKSAEQGRSRVGLGLATVVGTLLLNVTLADPRRNEESGDTAT